MLARTPIAFALAHCLVLTSICADVSKSVRDAIAPFIANEEIAGAEDMRRFYQMMLDGGVWKGKRLLSEASVNELTRTLTGDIVTGFTDGMSWGLSFQVVKEPQGVTAMLNPGTFGHGSAYGTQSWADPATQTIYILMIQRRGFNNGDNSPVRRAFQTAAAAAVTLDQ